MAERYAGPNQTDLYPVRKLRVFLRGLKYAAFSNFPALYKIVISCIALAVSFFFQGWVDLLLIMLATAQILSAELLNSAVEEICDFIHPEENERIGGIKDMAAAAAGISMLIWVIVMGYQYYAIVNYVLSYGEVPQL